MDGHTVENPLLGAFMSRGRTRTCTPHVAYPMCLPYPGESLYPGEVRVRRQGEDRSGCSRDLGLVGQEPAGREG